MTTNARAYIDKLSAEELATKFIAHNRTDVLGTFDTLRDANRWSTATTQQPTYNGGIAMRFPSGSEMALWDFTVWSTGALRHLEDVRTRRAAANNQ